ncbi:glyoxylase-like metal-dependent hydrolase (beta-lactamase superfamily II) [Lutibacter oceani]|uniref:Glyoxylase-like metal-dependent hydrolase (Beta-lactamase superfamily II) n=1 Tax=Lutibacter oceani TaxID=1853311 RepID=A0A3D9RT61_9FLAO|nr:MBL fold metallo-hydrolase [Lutibacter oceani]REE80714.1 glyoxylase-like metal-dependent hydrolase (beta-lactamase superfamily II) [Lutibacter oceani]
MKVEQLFTGCLAEMAYYIHSNGEAAIIDPLRETEPYIEMAKADGAKIKYVFLTHFHADFVSGQVDLAKKTGATIVFGPNAQPNYDIHQGKDGEEFKIGNLTLKLLHTPGHTMESSSYLLIDEKGNMPYVFTGDCLFIGDVGRPDLAVKSDLTQEDLAGHLFDSLRNKIMTLPDDIIVYPNHGAGSACGKNMSSETFDTLGNQKKTNYALRADMTKEEFIAEVTTGLKPAPQYFGNNVRMNKGVNTSIDEILKKGTTPIDADSFKEMSERDDILVVDTRSKELYAEEGTVPGAWYIGVEGGFAPWVGALIKDINQKIIFIAEEGREHEVVTRFSRVGYDNILGYLRGGIHSWLAAGHKVDKIGSISAVEFANRLKDGKIEAPLDVRKESEYQSEHVVGVENFPLDFIHSNFAEIKPDKEYVLHCASGYRSLIAASIFMANGVKNVTDVRGGFKDIKDTGVKLTEYVCPTTLL